MNNRVNYSFVGLIVVMGVALMLGFTYWMLKPTEDDDVRRYTIYFNESVLGLNIDAPVKYRGINVGKVVDLGINPKNSEQVEVTIEVLKSTPIKVDTLAKLTAQGITGLTYINLSQGSHISAELTAKEGEKYPVIKTAPSFFTNFENSLSSVSTRLSSTLGKTEELLGADNQREVSLLLKNSASVMDRLDRLLDERTINNLQQTAENMNSFSRKLNAIMPDIDKFLEKSVSWEQSTADSFESVMDSYLGIKDAMDEIKRAVASGEFNVKAMGEEIIPSVNSTLLEMQELMIQMEESLEQYKESPSDILYKRQEIKKAPGEE